MSPVLKGIIPPQRKTTAYYLPVCAPLKASAVLELNCLIQSVGGSFSCWFRCRSSHSLFRGHESLRTAWQRVRLSSEAAFHPSDLLNDISRSGIRGRACVRAPDVKMEVDIKPPQGQTRQNEMHVGFLLHWLLNAGFFHFVSKQKVRLRRTAWRQVTDYFNTAHIPAPNSAIKLGILNNLYTYAPGNEAPLVKVLLFVQTLPLVK